MPAIYRQGMIFVSPFREGHFFGFYEKSSPWMFNGELYAEINICRTMVLSNILDTSTFLIVLDSLNNKAQHHYKETADGIVP